MATAAQKNKASGAANIKSDAQSDPVATTTYSALVVINHDDELYEVGSPIELTDKQAAPLLVVGAIALPDDKAAE